MTKNLVFLTFTSFFCMNSISIDAVVIPVVKNRPQFGTGRAKARVFVHSVVEAEEELLGKISKRSFIPELCNAYLYLKHTFNTEEITYDMVRPLAHFFAHYLNFQLTREYYRRRKTLIYWLNCHYLAIRAFTGMRRIKVQYKNNTYNLE